MIIDHEGMDVEAVVDDSGMDHEMEGDGYEDEDDNHVMPNFPAISAVDAMVRFSFLHILPNITRYNYCNVHIIDLLGR